MRVTVRVVGGEAKDVEIVGAGRKVKDVIRDLGLLTEEYIVMRGSRVLTDEDEVCDGDELVLIPVVSGG